MDRVEHAIRNNLTSIEASELELSAESCGYSLTIEEKSDGHYVTYQSRSSNEKLICCPYKIGNDVPDGLAWIQKNLA